MTPKLTKELADALHINGSVPLPVVDPANDQTYFIVHLDEMTEEARERLQEQQKDLAAIKKGVNEADSGLGVPLEDAMKKVYSNINARQW